MKIKVFKFGGASVQDAESIQNMANIIKEKRGNVGLVVVVSAIGKTTNALEAIYESFLKKENPKAKIAELQNQHFLICKNLFENDKHEVFSVIESLFLKLSSHVDLRNEQYNRDEKYDEIISFGEILSTNVISRYLNEIGLKCHLLDAKNYIKTDRTWRDAKIDWLFTDHLMNRDLPDLLAGGIIMTQGFLGGTTDGRITTLGREGSDYSAACFASCLNAEDLTIWKDVPGVLNGDPKIFPDAELFERLSYSQAAEMTFFGASVIHPKTIKPLANKKIPLYVRSFINSDEQGTVISEHGKSKDIPTVILKKNQVLISFSVRDFTFINEKHLSMIFGALDGLNLKISLFQRSAITFSVALDYNRPDRVEELINGLSQRFDIKKHEYLELLTVIFYNDTIIEKLVNSRKIFLEQTTGSTIQLVVSQNNA